MVGATLNDAQRRSSAPGALRAWLVGWAPVLLLCAGLLVRLIVWSTERGYTPFGDEQYYYRGAVIFAQTGAYSDPPTPAWLPVQRVPLLSLLAGLLFRLGGIDLGPVNLVQIGLSLGLAWYAWRWATRLWGVVAGRWALALALAYPTLITHPATFLYTETLYAFLAASAIELLSRLNGGRSAWLAAAAGCTMGLTALTRSSGVVLLGTAWLWLGLTGWRVWRRPLTVGLIILATWALTIAPWTLRNYRTYGGLLLLDTIGAYNLWRDNALPGDRVADVLARLPNPLEQQRVATERGLANILAAPDRFLARLPDKALFLWHLELDSYARGGGYFEDLTNRGDSFGWVLAHDLALLVVSALGLIGIALAPWPGAAAAGHRRLQLLLLLWIIANLAAGTIFHSESRFRIPYQIQMIVFAGGALVAGRSSLARARQQPWRGLLAVALLVWLLAGAWSPRLLPVLQMQGWLITGDAMGQWDRAGAIAAYTRAVAAMPDSDRPLIVLGEAHRRQGETAAAVSAFRAALAIQPHSISAAMPLVDIELKAGEPERARRTLREVGSSDVDLMTWSWRHFQPSPASVVDLGSGLEVAYLSNFYPGERGEIGDFRWTNGNGLIRLTAPPTGATGLTVSFNGTRLAAGPSQRIEVVVNGRVVGRSTSNGSWQRQRFDLQGLNLAPGAAILVELRSDTFVPSRVMAGNRDTRLLGIAVDRVELD